MDMDFAFVLNPANFVIGVPRVKTIQYLLVRNSNERVFVQIGIARRL